MSQKRNVIIFLSDTAKAYELVSRFSEVEFDCVISDGTDHFCRTVNTQCVDLIIIDQELPGFLTGIEVIERLQKNLLRPTTILLAAPTTRLRERVAALQVTSLIRPTAGAEEIAEMARAGLSAGSVAQVPIHPLARQLVQQADIIQPLPQIVVKYASQLEQDGCSALELARDISADPKTTSVVLRLMNSSAFAVRTRTTRVLDAVNYLGVKRTIAFILSASLTHSQSKLIKSFPEALRAWHQTRGVLIASTAAAFARRTGECSPDTAYILGLIQELGIPVLAYAHGDRYIDLVRRSREVGQIRLEITEQQEFDFTHADVAAALLQKWDMPQSLIRPVINHHRNEEDWEVSTAERKFLQMMCVGEAFANLFDNRTPQRHQMLTRLMDRFELGTTEDRRVGLAEAVAKAVESSQLFSIPVPDERTLRGLVSQLSVNLSEEGLEWTDETPSAANPRTRPCLAPVA